MIGERRNIARAMQHADNNHRVGERPVINRVSTVECDAQSRGELLTRRRSEREVSRRLERGLDRRDEAGCYYL